MMLKRCLFVVLATAELVLAGDATVARRIKLGHELAMNQWLASVQAARNPADRAEIRERRPDVTVAGQEVWREIRNDLSEPWTIDFATWLLAEAPSVLQGKPGVGPREARQTPAQQIHQAMAKYHLKSPRIGPYCLAMTLNPPADALEILQKIGAENPSDEVRGAAAFGQSLLLKRLGDEPAIVRKRLPLIRQAIISSIDLEIGDVTLGKIAGDELYRIQHLVVGRPAPDFQGRDVAGRAISLSANLGKVTVVFFWNTWMPEAERAIKLMRDFRQGADAAKVVVLGVTPEPVAGLRQMVADREVPWPNVTDVNLGVSKKYRISEWPQVFVLDQKGIIQYVGPPGAFMELAVKALVEGD